MPNILNRNSLLFFQILLNQFDQDIFDFIKNLSTIHKLTYKVQNMDKNIFTFADYFNNIDETLAVVERVIPLIAYKKQSLKYVA